MARTIWNWIYWLTPAVSGVMLMVGAARLWHKRAIFILATTSTGDFLVNCALEVIEMLLLFWWTGTSKIKKMLGNLASFLNSFLPFLSYTLIFYSVL
jgi:hypothetical protein